MLHGQVGQQGGVDAKDDGSVLPWPRITKILRPAGPADMETVE